MHYLKMRRMVLAIWFHECNLIAKSFSNSLQRFCFLINVSNWKTFHIVSWPAYICTYFPPNVFCSTTTLQLLLPPHLFTKSVGSLVEESDCPRTLLPPGVGLSALNVRLNSSAKHIFLWF